MKIGIISDTHITKNVLNFMDLLNTHLNEVDIIIHAGDYINLKVIEELKKYKNLVGVWGNVDDAEVKNLINEKEVFIAEGYKIGIFHGHGTNKTTVNRAYEKFKEDDVDIIIFGHSHQPLVKTKDGILMINPGSLTNKRQEKWFSYAILDLNQEHIDLQFKFLADKKI